jgi:hypothetical protein
MSIYTYNFSRSLCEILNITFIETPDISDQELIKTPVDAISARTGWGKAGVKRLPESNKLQSEAQKGKKWCHNPITFEEKLTHNIPTDWLLGRNPSKLHGGRLGVYNKSRSDKISASLKGRTSWNTGIGHSDETKEKFKSIAINRPMFSCPHCNKQIKGESNLKQHIRGRH